MLETFNIKYLGNFFKMLIKIKFLQQMLSYRLGAVSTEQTTCADMHCRRLRIPVCMSGN